MVTQIGRYTVTERIGSGSYGDVYRAFDPRLNREVAVKITRETHLGGISADMRDLFENERAVLGAIEHPNVVRVYDAGEEDNRLFIVTELLHGLTLRQEIASNTIPESRARRLGAGIAA